MNLFELLTASISEEQFHLHPLNDHAISTHDVHVRRQYVLLLAATLTAQPAISEFQTRLFRLLLNSVKLGDIRGQLYQQARELTPELLLDAICCMRKQGLASRLLVDLLVLLHIDTQLRDDIVPIVSELASALGLEETYFAKLTKIASCILGLTINEDDTDPYDYDGKLWYKRVQIWPGEPSPIVQENLRIQIEAARVRQQLHERKLELEREQQRQREEREWERKKLEMQNEWDKLGRDFKQTFREIRRELNKCK